VIGRGSAILPGFQIMAIMAIPAIMAISLGFPITAMTRGPVPACRGSRAMTGDPGNSSDDPINRRPDDPILPNSGRLWQFVVALRSDELLS
jgi:hypothetical protein